MSRVARERPTLLAKKLKQIRVSLGLSQNEMVNALGLAGRSERSQISGYERGTREPPLPVLLKYARLAGISTDLLIDDSVPVSRMV